jgi:hypothetical protein
MSILYITIMDFIHNMQSFMFTPQKIEAGYNFLAKPQAGDKPQAVIAVDKPQTVDKPPAVIAVPKPQTVDKPPAVIAVPKPPPTVPKPQAAVIKPYHKVADTFFTPFPKDKLFWCFFILLKGHEEYELYKTNSFAIEKQIKIEAVEKLKSIKDKLKELKLKRTELEDELVNQREISLKGLYALCLIHTISIVYVKGRTYYEINTKDTVTKPFIIFQNHKKEASIKWCEQPDKFIETLQKEYWLIESIQKPLKAPSAYTLQELQNVCERLQIETQTTLNDKIKVKTKTKLYEEILQNIE